MNRKIFSGLLLLTLVTGGVGTFTSCTDHEQDFQNKILTGQKDLSDDIEAIRNFIGEPFAGSTLNDRIDAQTLVLKSQIQACETRLDSIEEHYASKAYVQEAISDSIENVKIYVDKALENYMTKAAIEAAIGKVDSIARRADQQASINKLAIDTLKYNIQQLELRVDTLSSDVKQLKEDIEKIDTNFVPAVQALFDRYAQVLENLVTGLIVERTYNPVFGTINLPMGLESNMLINYYYKPVESVTFPDAHADEHNEYGQNSVFNKTYYIPTPTNASEFDWNKTTLETLGKLYLTINPIERDLDGLTFELVKSNGEALPVKFEAESCDEVLTFGYTRAANANGFYWSNIAPEEDGDKALIDATILTIDDKLKAAFEDIVNNHTEQDFLQLAKALYEQFDGILPAYAAKVSWKEPVVSGAVVSTDGLTPAETEYETKSVLSGYDLAVASFRPLSYSTGYGKHIDSTLPVPNFGSLKSLIDNALDELKSNLQLGFKEITGLDNINISISDISLDIQPTVIAITIPPITISDGVAAGSTTEETTIYIGYDGDKVNEDLFTDYPANATALNSLIAQIQDAVQNMINGDESDSLISQINSQIESQIINQVNDMLADINSQLESVQAKIDNTIEDIRTRIDDALNGRLGSAAQSLYNLYSRFATKFNSIISNPNAYLQVVAGYETVNGEMYHLSTDASDPTVVGKGLLKLFLTSYNAELIVPSYKKYVSINKVDATAADAALNTKAGEDFNKILNGRQQLVAFNTEALGAGDYQIFYQSLDFRGYTSTQVYYVRVKD